MELHCNEGQRSCNIHLKPDSGASDPLQALLTVVQIGHQPSAQKHIKQ